MNKSIILPTALAMVLLLSACTPKPETTTTQESNPATAQQQTQPAAADTAMEKTEEPTDTEAMEATDAEVDYTIDMSNFKFAPNAMTAAPGQILKVKIVSVEGFHDFVVDELDVKSKQLKSDSGTDSEQVFEVMIPEDAPSGTEYEFYCSVGQHRANGMTGTITVK